VLGNFVNKVNSVERFAGPRRLHRWPGMRDLLMHLVSSLRKLNWKPPST